MPTISVFYGIIIRMYWADSDKHKAPHFHAYYGDHEAVFDLEGNVMAGAFPSKQAALVHAWALLHGDELAANWTLANGGEAVERIAPLR